MKSFGNVRKPNQGFTMTEVIVAALIFAMATAGIMATVSALSQPASESMEEVNAAFVGKSLLDQLRRNVDATDWEDSVSGALHPNGGPWGNGTYNMGATVIGGVSYDVNYTVVVDPETSARKVTVDIDW